MTDAAAGPPARRPIRARVIVASNRASSGVYADRSGPILVDGLRALGCEVDDPVVVADGPPVAHAKARTLTLRRTELPA